MEFTISPFKTSNLNQLTQLPPKEWQSNVYELFLHNEWQPWFFPYQAMVANKLAGFGMFFLFEENAWLGWILVDKKFRNQGIGTAITTQMVEKAKELGAKNLILTATELGMPIYEKLGFRISSHYRFFNPPELIKPIYERSKIRPASKKDLNRIMDLDTEATGEKRTELIRYYLEDCFVYENIEVTGFYMPNFGNGYVVASNRDSGIELLNFRLKKNKKCIAIPDQNEIAIEYFLQNGFTEGYKIPRMILGKEPAWKPGMIFSRAAGYCG
ncbi:MAG TPA: GNAT family N-acetyltransferase [Prolixibacteraceae bacterium]|nr:GNAT family N-acetyltransferase [Prolixibacteraceae bacterium]HPS12292.1 GNAT family N-acetyltransferase [Prolixibacteraceae bacterium]